MVGALKVEEHMVIQSLMGHLSRQANIELREAGGEQGVKTGTRTWMGRIDPSASAGRSRIYLQNQAEVQTVKATLDGRTIKVGTDSFLVRVHNDLDIRKSRGLGPQRLASPEGEATWAISDHGCMLFILDIALYLLDAPRSTGCRAIAGDELN